jgi:hypothetical protein
MADFALCYNLLLFLKVAHHSHFVQYRFQLRGDNAPRVEYIDSLRNYARYQLPVHILSRFMPSPIHELFQTRQSGGMFTITKPYYSRFLQDSHNDCGVATAVACYEMLNHEPVGKHWTTNFGILKSCAPLSIISFLLFPDKKSSKRLCLLELTSDSLGRAFIL